MYHFNDCWIYATRTRASGRNSYVDENTMRLEEVKADQGGRRASDRVSRDHAFEMIATLAMEYALQNDAVDSDAVQLAIDKCRESR